MKRCPKCGRTYDNDARFCMHCGVDLEAVLDVQEESDEIRERFEAQERARAQEKAENAMYDDWSHETMNDAAFDAGNSADGTGWQQGTGAGGQQANAGGQQANPGGWQGAQNASNTGDAAQFGQGNASDYGFQQAPNYGTDPNGGFTQGGPIPNNSWQEPPRYIKRRSIVSCVLLSIFTFGIYYLYWMAVLADDLNAVVKGRDGSDTSGVAVVLLSIITFGIYGLYWMYKSGEKCDWLCGERNGSRPILFLVIGLFGFGIITLALIQDVLNMRLYNR